MREGAAAIEPLDGEDEVLLVGRNALLVLDLRFNVVDGVEDSTSSVAVLSGESLDEDLRTSAEMQDEMEGGVLLDVGQCAQILELLLSKDEMLLVRGILHV
ncbi:hypothetical protein FIBSPDRAFT_1045797 [Athelia psychrophila]|uniref:Uncharacterized protein n=1 Tax=Athelia psychrophila TaxID=1759441 RepID=A0A166HN75_9AGAM|nr:hypothetical protein FIBSPDRAFT_1045797 [Fibularhizoctonia sp. CBS 109695]